MYACMAYPIGINRMAAGFTTLCAISTYHH